MNAHQLDANGVILNTIVVDSLDVFPNLIDASVGGWIGDTWNGTAIVKAPPRPPTPYQELRAAAYPSANDYLDGIAKGDAAQVQAYIDACLAVKARYPKP